MSSELAIDARGLGKGYLIYDRPQALWRRRRGLYREFWALKGVSFQVKKGETIGIIGRNGSGKSTLLQLLCGTLAPTEGQAEIHGRVAALLELGSGFNPDFTGRENVHLNAAVLGLSRDEIDARYESIASFADIGEFINRPVKTYSSGMCVRLAFAVAVSIDPDILVVDEALSVGDDAFQRKCFSRIHQFKEAGATVLFVSHSASAVIELCSRAILLDAGQKVSEGAPKEIVSWYHKLIFASDHERERVRSQIIRKADPDEAQGGTGPQRLPEPNLDAFYDSSLVPKSTLAYESRGARISQARLTTTTGRRANHLVSGERYIYSYEVRFERTARHVRFGMMTKTLIGAELAGAVSAPAGAGIALAERGTTVQVSFEFRCCFNPGVYFVNAGVVGLSDGAEVYLDRQIDAAMFRVVPLAKSTSTGPINFEAVPRLRIAACSTDKEPA